MTTTDPTPGMPTTAVDFDWTVTEGRKQQLDLDGKRLAVEHSVHLHRDSQSIRDLRQMLDLLVTNGAPEDATVYVQKTDHPEGGSFMGRGHLRIMAKWSTAQPGVTK